MATKTRPITTRAPGTPSPEAFDGCASSVASSTMPSMADESNHPEHRFERRLVTGPNAEHPPAGPKVELDAKTRAELHETFRRLDREQTEAYSASHEYYLS